MEFKDIINNLESRSGKKKSYDFNRMRSLLLKLENPQKDLKYFHIAGTNGKGSTSNFIYNILKAKGYKTGLYTSPHLVKYNERIIINDDMISDDDFIRLFEKVLVAEDEIKVEFEDLTFFEVITALSFLYFKENKCDYCVLEVGMGGLSDSTNVIDACDVLASIITPISMDHTEFLGDTIEEIAVQKAGIIKNNTLVATSNSDEKVLDILKETAEINNSNIYSLKDLEIYNVFANEKGSIYSLKYKDIILENIKTSLMGYYQIYNSALAILTTLELRIRGILNIDNKSILTGINNAYWPGRMEKIHDNPMVVLDGAHNLDGIKNLTKNLNIFKYDKLYIIASILKDKEHDKMLKELSLFAQEIILVDLNTKRKTDISILEKEVLKYNTKVSVIEDLNTAIIKTLNAAKKNDLIIISGSLYLVSDVKEIILKNKNSF